MQFTPQQLSGAGKYNSGVRIGNWNEDVILEEVRSKSRSYHKNCGNRELDSNIRGTKHQLQPVTGELVKKGEVLKFGQFITIAHEETGNVLASNIAESANSAQLKDFECQVTVSPNTKSCLRNVFQIVSAKGEHEDGDTVCYGDPVYLKTMSLLRVNPLTNIVQRELSLYSAMGRVNSATYQGVTLSSSHMHRNDQYIRWKILPVNATQHSMKRVRYPVEIEASIQILHCATGKSLYSTSTEFVLNHFGQENVIMCNKHMKKNRTHVLKAECSGFRDGDHVVPVLERNWWKISAFQSIKVEVEGAPLTVDSILAVLKDDLLRIGADEVFEFLKALDETKDGVIRKADFMWGLLHCGCRLAEDELYCLANYLVDGNDGICVEVFQKLIDE